MQKPIQIVVGGQFGSEAKGAIAGYLALRDNIQIAVRTGATNAGHTVVYDGTRYSMQQIPVGWVNPNTALVLGAGSLIDPVILRREIELITKATGTSPVNRMFIDTRAYIHAEIHHQRAAEANRHHSMGATGKGCSEALIDRVRLRGSADFSVANNMHEMPSGPAYIDTESMLNAAYDAGARIQLEGTQGQLLDLYLGPYPYVTHKQTGPALWLSEAGFSPNVELDIVAVMRTYPIRVAGNSGPMPSETSWPILARKINLKRDAIGHAPIVSESSITAFESAVCQAAMGMDMPIINGQVSGGLDMHNWSDDTRAAYRVVCSELHKKALEKLQPEVLRDLGQLFEMTTVTKKLRRIAYADPHTVTVAARQIRPTQVALTFFNYEFPDAWYTSENLNLSELNYCRQWSNAMRAPITLVGRGPDPAHIVETGIRRG